MKVGIIICDRYKSCAGEKCFRAIKSREMKELIKPALSDEKTRIAYN